jgi:pimeloyl-ACP methyl ester carboxylesterase
VDLAAAEGRIIPLRDGDRVGPACEAIGHRQGRNREHVSKRIGRLKSVWTAVNGLRVHARVSVEPVPPDSPVVVLVHGVGVSSRYMIPTAVRLAPYCAVYVPDLPGFGKSDKPSRVLNVAELSDALAAWMTAAGLNQAALLGNSFGCQIVVDFAIRHPERIERAVLVGPTVDPQGRTVPQQVLRWLCNGAHEPLSLDLTVLRDYWDCGLFRPVRTFQYALRDRIEEKLPHVQVPALVVRGSRDAIVPQRWVEEATRLLPIGRLVVIPGAAHAVNYNAPLKLSRVVEPFLGEGGGSQREEARG